MIIHLLDQIQALKETGEPFAIATVVRAEKPTSAKPGAVALITSDGTLTGWIGGSCAAPAVKEEALKALSEGTPRLLRLCPPEALGQGTTDGVTEVVLTCISGGTYEIYIEPQLVQPELIILGHLATSEALARLAKAMGYPVTVMGWDVNPQRFAFADHVVEGLDLNHVKVTGRTFIIVASHGNYDEPALEAAFKTPAPYIALVASPRRAEAVMQYLRDSDLPHGWQERFKYPAGLNIGAVTEDEIALSILAEMVEYRRRRSRAGMETVLAIEEPEVAKDPVCGMSVQVENAHFIAEYNDRTYYFCCAGCKRAFETAPETFLVEE